MQMIDATVVTTPAEAQDARWKTRAVEEYEGSLPDRRTRLRTDLATRLLGLTGRPLSLEDVYVDSDGSLAVAGEEG